MGQRIVCVVLVLAGCAASSTSDPGVHCEETQVVAPSSGREPATLQFGAMWDRRSPSYAMLAARSDGGVAYLSCGDIVVLDGRLREIARVSEVGRPDHFSVRFALASDDAIYESDGGGLLAMSPTGEKRWTTLVESALPVVRPEGPYLGASVVQGQMMVANAIFGFDAATGEKRTVTTGSARLFGGTRDGLLTLESTDQVSATLREIDLAGHVLWSRTLSTTKNSSDYEGLEIKGAAPLPDGGVVVIGSAPKPVDFGDRTLPAPDGSSFVAAFDAAGATRWAIDATLAGLNIEHVAVTAQGEILLAGLTAGSSWYDSNAFISVATSAGVITRTHHIDGAELQHIDAIAASPDGAVWFEVRSAPSDDNKPSPEMHIGDRTFTDTGTYLFKMVY